MRPLIFLPLPDANILISPGEITLLPHFFLDMLLVEVLVINVMEVGLGSSGYVLEGPDLVLSDSGYLVLELLLEALEPSLAAEDAHLGVCLQYIRRVSLASARYTLGSGRASGAFWAATGCSSREERTA